MSVSISFLPYFLQSFLLAFPQLLVGNFLGFFVKVASPALLFLVKW